jgi:anti-sigma factor RsiW
MDCSNIRSKLSAYVDGELSPETKSLVAQHLQSCAGCRDELSRLQSVDTELDRLADVEVRPYFSTRLHQRLADRRASRRSRWLGRMLVPTGAAVVMLLAAVAGTHLGQSLYSRRPLSTPQNTTVASSTSALDLLDGPGGSFYVTGRRQ